MLLCGGGGAPTPVGAGSSGVADHTDRPRPRLQRSSHTARVLPCVCARASACVCARVDALLECAGRHVGARARPYTGTHRRARWRTCVRGCAFVARTGVTARQCVRVRCTFARVLARMLVHASVCGCTCVGARVEMSGGCALACVCDSWRAGRGAYTRVGVPFWLWMSARASLFCVCVCVHACACGCT